MGNGAAREVVATRWDTLFEVGADSVNDTLFAGPLRIELVEGRVVIDDAMAWRLKAVNSSTGDVEWAHGGRGHGPQELYGVSDLQEGPDGTLWVLDFGNGRITALGPDGGYRGTRTLHGLPAPPAAILPLQNRIIAMSHGAPEPFMVLTADSLKLQRRFALPWPGTIPPRANTRVLLARGSGDAWAAAFALGPGFIVWTGGQPRAHRWIENIPFAMRVSTRLTRARADSARYAAVSLEIVEDEIFTLFGGRPVRAAHPGEPTLWVDVYGLDGNYRRSYKLPVDATAMTTDGSTFYVLHSTGITPALLAIRPRTGT